MGGKDKTVLHLLEHIAKSDGEVGDQTHFVIIASTTSEDNNQDILCISAYMLLEIEKFS